LPNVSRRRAKSGLQLEAAGETRWTELADTGSKDKQRRSREVTGIKSPGPKIQKQNRRPRPSLPTSLIIPEHTDTNLGPENTYSILGESPVALTPAWQRKQCTSIRTTKYYGPHPGRQEEGNSPVTSSLSRLVAAQAALRRLPKSWRMRASVHGPLGEVGRLAPPKTAGKLRASRIGLSIAHMLVRFLRAARSVTGSCHLVEAGGLKSLLDCGMFQGHDHERNRQPLSLDPRKTDYVVFPALTVFEGQVARRGIQAHIPVAWDQFEV